MVGVKFFQYCLIGTKTLFQKIGGVRLMHFEQYLCISINLYIYKNVTADLLWIMKGIGIKGCGINKGLWNNQGRTVLSL
jgi:hypothetical protein